MRPFFACLTVALPLLTAGAAVAQEAPREPPAAEPAPKEQALQGLQQLLRGIERMVKQIPTYSAPEMTPEGDIIIRRVRPEEAPADPAPSSPPDVNPGSTRT
ncbi:MAG TPA: hypothetical protein VEB64_14085 [Azospirillaceae bacterium]|nr:hypothetical protein [Azospirillaceae bacterium]